MTRQEAEAIFMLAGINILGIKKVPNDYWPSHENYDDMRAKYPWWTVTVDDGEITLGWRKRVITINWSKTNRRGEATKDDVTKSDDMVHAYSAGKAVQYLRNWKELPVVDVTDIKIRHHLLTARPEIVQSLKACFEPSTELDMLVGMISIAPVEMDVALTITAAKGYYTAHGRVGDLSITLFPARTTGGGNVA